MSNVWASTTYLRKLIVNWYNRSRGRKVEFTIFDRFVSLWMAFNAWGTHESQEDSDSNMIRWVKATSIMPSIFAQLMKSDKEFAKTVTELKNECPVYDMRPSHRTDYKTITNIHDFREILDVIYKIRCNLFHGQKSPDEKRDVRLATFAYGILDRLFEEILRKQFGV